MSPEQLDLLATHLGALARKLGWLMIALTLLSILAATPLMAPGLKLKLMPVQAGMEVGGIAVQALLAALLFVTSAQVKRRVPAFLAVNFLLHSVVKLGLALGAAYVVAVWLPGYCQSIRAQGAHLGWLLAMAGSLGVIFAGLGWLLLKSWKKSCRLSYVVTKGELAPGTNGSES